MNLTVIKLYYFQQKYKTALNLFSYRHIKINRHHSLKFCKYTQYIKMNKMHYCSITNINNIILFICT